MELKLFAELDTDSLPFSSNSSSTGFTTQAYESTTQCSPPVEAGLPYTERNTFGLKDSIKQCTNIENFLHIDDHIKIHQS